jgi:hypothetical protein
MNYNHTCNLMRFLLSVVLSGLILADVAFGREDSPLSAIFARYGGMEKVAETEVLYQEGRRCTLGDCRDFRSYRNGESSIRVEEAFSPPLWRVRVIRGREAKEFFVGPEWKRAWFAVAGVRDGPIPPDEVPGVLLDSRSLVMDFLNQAQRSLVAYVGKTVALNGREAYTFEQDLPERKAKAQYLFDVDTLLCLQRTLILNSKKEPFSYVVFSDYREVNGMPYPFRTETIDAKRKVTNHDETLSLVRIGGHLDESLFTATPNDPLWVFPLKALSFVAVIGAFFIWVLRRWRIRSRIRGGVPA